MVLGVPAGASGLTERALGIAKGVLGVAEEAARVAGEVLVIAGAVLGFTGRALVVSKTALEVAIRAMVIAGLTTQGSYVESRAAGNPATIALSNMGVRAASAPIGAMTKGLDLKTTTSDNAGELDWMCKPVPGAKAYIVQKCSGDPSVEANWSYATTETKSSGTLSGLASGNQWVRVAAKGAAADPGPWSDPAQEVVR